MTILRAKRQSKYKQLRIFLPTDKYNDVLNYMELYALANGVSKSSIVRELIVDWHVHKSSITSTTKLIDNIVYQVYGIWQNKKAKYDNFEEYLDQLEKELSGNRTPIDGPTVKIIIRKLYDKHEEK